ncbi:MAG: hypothetical protein P1P90_03120 [Patescibacteria group bacterium]|nr:hypothetical protein [Patescibacteria group bacterium]
MKSFAIIFSSLFVLGSLACDSGEDADFANGHTPADIPDEGGSEAAAGSAGSNTGTPCAPPGSTLECDDVCAGGVQECLEDKTLGPCVCPDSGSAGSSGSGGSAGSSGLGGSAGEAGSGGTGGSSGQAGSGGSAGTSGSGGSAGAGGSEPFSVECDQHGVQGEVIVFMNAPLPADHALLIFGWINFPNYMGPTADTTWGIWCFGENQDNTMTCHPKLDDGTDADIVNGTLLEMAPANHAYPSSSPNPNDANYYCEQDDCPGFTLVVCKGKKEVCGLRDGNMTGNMDSTGAPWPNPTCLVE